MKTKRLLIVLMASVLGLPGVYAQKVVVDGTKVIIDASAISHTTTKKPRTTTGTNSTSCTQSTSDIASNANNEKVYKKFEVSTTDNSTHSQWREAVDICADLATDGGGWRLPTQRELMLMWVLNSELRLTSGFTPFGPYGFWSATEGNTSSSWFVDFNFGNTYYDGGKVVYNRVRCVREI